MEQLQRQLQEITGHNNELVNRVHLLEQATAQAAQAATQAAAAARTAQPQRQQAALVDTRLMKQPNTFEGDREQWSDWAFTFRAYAASVSSDIAAIMRHAEALANPCGQFEQE